MKPTYNVLKSDEDFHLIRMYRYYEQHSDFKTLYYEDSEIGGKKFFETDYSEPIMLVMTENGADSVISLSDFLDDPKLGFVYLPTTILDILTRLATTEIRRINHVDYDAIGSIKKILGKWSGKSIKESTRRYLMTQAELSTICGDAFKIREHFPEFLYFVTLYNVHSGDLKSAIIVLERNRYDDFKEELTEEFWNNDIIIRQYAHMLVNMKYIPDVLDDEMKTRIQLERLSL